MDDRERLTRLEGAKDKHEGWLERHTRELDEIQTGFERDRAIIAEIRKGHEDQMALLVDHEGLILSNQRRIIELEEKDRRQEKWFEKMNLLVEKIGMKLDETTDKLNALIHWDMERHGYPEGGSSPTQ